MAADYILVERNSGQWKPFSTPSGDIYVYGNYDEALYDKCDDDLLCEVRYPASGILVLWWKLYGVEFAFNKSSEEDFQRKLHEAVSRLNIDLPCEIVRKCEERGMIEDQYFDADCVLDFVFSSEKEDIDDILDEFEDLPAIENMTRKVFVYTSLWKNGDKFKMSCKTKAFGDYREAAAELQADAKEAIQCFTNTYGEGVFDYTSASSDHAICECNLDIGWVGDSWNGWIEVQDVEFVD